jgi:hypothetical protein
MCDRVNRVDLGFLWFFGTSLDIFSSRKVFFSTIQTELIISTMFFFSGVKGENCLVDDLEEPLRLL